MKKILLILLMMSSSIFAQKKINNYKYVIVPSKFDFVKKVDEYKTSSLTKFLFNKYGFTALLSSDKLPDDLAKDRCLALTATVRDESTMFTTKNILELKDCYNKTLFSTKVGKSKNKEYKNAYHEAIRDAFKSIQSLKYEYIPAKNTVIEIQKENVTTINEPKVIKIEKSIITKEVNEVVKSSLYAQSIINGFQLVNTKPEVVFQIVKTNVKDVFIIKNKNGIMYKNDTLWVAEYYKEDVKVMESYQIKF
jgi:hypothetical protein